MDMMNKVVLVVGTGISGIAAAELILEKQGKVILFDGNQEAKEEEIRSKFLKASPQEVLIGDLPEEKMIGLDLVILSPGVPTDIPLVEAFKQRKIPIWGEVELAYHFSKGRIVGITGTNGKTTTTALVGQIMKAYYNDVYIVGNIGIPYTQMVKYTEDDSIIVAEMSSFQLETIEKFRPNVSAILNISPDHLNRHHTMEAYIDAKMNICKNQTSEDILVLNYDDLTLRKIGENISAKVFYFSSHHRLDEGVYLDQEQIFYKTNKKEILICHINELKLLGIHNYENIMAGIAIGISLQVPIEQIYEGITSFESVEHRIEYVEEIRGVKYYNDSKGTNPDAAIKGIQAMVTPTLLIGGGYDKDSDYKEWILSFEHKVRHLVLIGQTRDKIAKTAKELGFEQIILADSLQEAVTICYDLAEPGDSVLLSPACASWGMFCNYEERGNRFKELVRQLK